MDSCCHKRLGGVGNFDGQMPGWGGVDNCKTSIGSAIVAMAAAIVTIANVVIAVVVEPQQSWS